jgi:hypothetical protein
MAYITRTKKLPTAMMGLGQPVTSTTDPSLTETDTDIVVGVVNPSRIGCNQLPADSPWREPGQVCAPPPLPSGGLIEWGKSMLKAGENLVSAVVDVVTPSATTPPPSTDMSTTTKVAIAAAVGVGAYYLLRKKRR